MMPLFFSRLSFIALILSVIAGISYSQKLKIDQLRAQRDKAQHLVLDAQQSNLEKEALLKTLRQQAREHEAEQLVLQHELTRIHQVHTQREATIQKSYETQQVHTWANALLPQPIIRLRQHDAFTGANAYVERLPQRDPLPTTRQCAPDKRRAESRSRSR